MDYSFEAIPKQGYLHIRVRGNNDVPTTRRYVGDLLKACADQDCPNVLIEENLEGRRLSIGAIFQLLSEQAETVRAALHIIAFVDASPERLPSNLSFAETVALNRGLNVRGFSTVDEAERWLRGELSAGQGPPS